jgi:cytochrome b561
MEPRYHSVAKWLHWLMAAAIVAMLAIGWIMTDESLISGPPRFALYQWHKSLGITILALAIIRLGWRLLHPAPPYPDSMKLWEKWAAQGVHIALYALMIGMPLTGWLLSSASPYKTVIYGLVPLPNLPWIADQPNRQELGHFFGETHETLALVLAAFALIHVGAALKHHFVHRDDIMLRMAPKALHSALLKIRGKS